MSFIQVIRSLGPVDMRSVGRDSALRWMLFLPILCALILRFGVPPLTASLLESNGFDLTPYYPVLLAYFFVIMCPMIFGVLIGFLLLDEKDDNTLIALQVTPLSLNKYLAYRVTIPIVLTIILMFIIFPMAALGEADSYLIGVSAIAAAPMSPMFALYIASIAKNKVQGFALMKLSGMVLFAPIFSYFIESGWEFLFGIIPTYWPMKVYWLLEAGESNVWLYVLVAVVYQSAVTAYFARRLYRQVHS